MDLNKILCKFIDDTVKAEITKFGDGLIHGSYLVSINNQPAYILQQLNTGVFKQPELISHNLELLSNHLASIQKERFFPLPLKTETSDSYVIDEGKYYRLTPYVKDSHSINACSTPEQAFEAAYQFGRFTAAFTDFNPRSLSDPIAKFHDLAYRWQQFVDAMSEGNRARIKFAKNEIDQIQSQYSFVEKYLKIKSDNSFLERVTHHDTKISNILFDHSSKGICVIDLDTVMSGYFISDLGDMFRTYLSSATEEEQDFERVVVRKDFYKAIVEGYLETMKDNMTSSELHSLNFAGEFMIYMQALRFMTDYINDDVYYGTTYELNNYNRAINQLKLLHQYQSLSS